MVAIFNSSSGLAPRLLKLTGFGAIAIACSGPENFFKEPANLAGRHAGGASADAGATASGGQGASSGALGTTGGSGGRDGSGVGGSDGGTSVGGQLAGGGKGQGGSAGMAPVAGAPTAGSPSAGGSGGDGSVAGGGTTGGDAGAEPGGAGGEPGVAGEPGTGGTGGEPCIGEPERCDGVSNDCDDDIDEGGACPVGCEAKEYDGHLYLLCLFENANDQPDYSTATKACADAKSTGEIDVALALARLDSADENAFVKAWIVDAMTGEGAVWHGANDLDQERHWVWGREPNEVPFFNENMMGGGMPVMGRFNDWGAGRPNASNGANEDCGAFDSEVDWKWNDVQCSVPRLGYVCEQTP